MVNFLIANGADINHKAILGFTPLHLGAQLGSLDIVKYLLMNGAYFDAKTQVDRYALPLNFAEESGDLKVIELLKLTEKLFIAVKSNNFRL